jgi:hypothetical protein
MRDRKMFERIAPQRLGNRYRGRRLALWLYGLVVIMKIAQSQPSSWGGYPIAKDADRRIPVDTYPPAIAGMLVAVLAQGS